MRHKYNMGDLVMVTKGSDKDRIGKIVGIRGYFTWQLEDPDFTDHEYALDFADGWTRLWNYKEHQLELVFEK